MHKRICVSKPTRSGRRNDGGAQGDFMKRIGIATLGGFLLLIFAYGLYPNLLPRMIHHSDVAAPSVWFIPTQIAEENAINKLTLRIKGVSLTGRVTVEIDNPSRKPIRIWKDSNSWGAARWRVLRIRNRQVETFFQNPDQEFTRNGPGFHVVAGGGHVQQKLDLNGGNWCGFAHCSSYKQLGLAGQKVAFEQSDLIIVIYDVPFTPESLSLGVWYGVSATSSNAQ